METLLQEIRGAGWVVAVHNDYCQDGIPHTFWLFTKDGHAVKGEGLTDREALIQCAKQIGLDDPKPDRVLHESSELTRGDLIFFIASLRGALVDPKIEDWEKRRVLAGTSFNISKDDDEAYDKGKKRYFDSGDFAVGDEK